MGAIVADFEQLPQDADPNRARLYQGVYEDLARLGLALPAQAANVITRAQLLAHLQALAGQIVKSEIAGDPEGLDYQGATDAIQADLLNLPASRRVNGIRYTIAAPLSAAVLTVAEGGLLALADSIDGGTLIGRRVRFTRLTSTPALRTVTATIGAFTDNTITPTAALAVVPAAGDRFRILNPFVARSRINELLMLPYCPNALQVADITAAKV